MKTTLDLPDDLALIEAKAVAARRRTTLRALIEQSLRRELAAPVRLSAEESEHLQVGPLGILQLRRSSVTSEGALEQMEDVEDEEFRDALAVRDGRMP